MELSGASCESIKCTAERHSVVTVPARLMWLGGGNPIHKSLGRVGTVAHSPGLDGAKGLFLAMWPPPVSGALCLLFAAAFCTSTFPSLGTASLNSSSTWSRAWPLVTFQL